LEISLDRWSLHTSGVKVCTFTETILFRFQGFAYGAEPEDDLLVIDANGNIFGTTAEGGNLTACPSDGFGTPGGFGVVFEVRP
jgi:hypothetical protein